MNIMSIKGAKKKLGENKVLRGIDLDIKEGEILALVGPSGSGKSTLLRAMNRLIEIDSGSIRFRKEDIREMDPVELRRNAVLVPQESVMLPGTVMENVTYGPRLAQMESECNISGCLEDAGLSNRFAKRNASKLSGGEKKRVALARALALKPDVLLLDEPTVGVDPKRVKKVESTILEIAESRELTVIWVTHDAHQAMRIADRIANLKRGRVKEVKRVNEFEWEGAY